MPILNRLILVLQLILATSVSCRCGLELLLEPTGCNLVVCGDLEKAEADDCCPDEDPPDEVSANDCCPDGPAGDFGNSGNSGGGGGGGGDCLCCTSDSELALMGRDQLVPVASNPVIFAAFISADWQRAFRMPEVLPHRLGTQRGVAPPATLLRQRTLLQI